MNKIEINRSKKFVYRYVFLSIAFTIFAIFHLILNNIILGILHFIVPIIGISKSFWDITHPYIIYENNEIIIYPDMILSKIIFNKNEVLSIENDSKKDIYYVYLKNSKKFKIHLKMIDNNNYENIMLIINDLKKELETASN